MSGASERANGQASGLVLTSVLVSIFDHSARPISMCRATSGRKKEEQKEREEKRLGEEKRDEGESSGVKGSLEVKLEKEKEEEEAEKEKEEREAKRERERSKKAGV